MKTQNYHNVRGPDGRFISKKKTARKRTSRPRPRRRASQEQVTRIAILADVSGSMYTRATSMKKIIGDQIRVYENQPNQKNIITLYPFSTRIQKPFTDLNSESFSGINFRCEGLTAIRDAIRVAIEDFQQNDNGVDSLLIIGFTDGMENSSHTTKNELACLMNKVMSDDRVTITFMVPKGYERNAVNATGIIRGNISSWGTIREAGEKMVSAANQYSSLRASGKKSTSSFYEVNADCVNSTIMERLFEDKSNDFVNFYVTSREGRAAKAKSGGMSISDFIDYRLKNMSMSDVRGSRYERSEGRAFYQLTKTETIQHHKQVAVMTSDGKIYTGSDARKVLNMPDDNYTEIKVKPGDLGDNRLFVSSTSGNRVLMANTTVLYRKF